MYEHWENDLRNCLTKFKADLTEVQKLMPKEAHQTDAGTDAAALLGRIEAMLEYME